MAENGQKSAEKEFSLEEFRLKSAPDTIYYIPNFISEDEEEFLLRKVNNVPKPKWTQLSHRRLQNWGGLPHEKGMVTENIPDWLTTYMEKIAGCGAFNNLKPNHVLVNEYTAGQGIMPHLDGSLYWPTVSTISLGSHTLLDFYQPLNEGVECETESSQFEERHFLSIFVQPRSLILVKDDMYNKYLHGIKENCEDIITDKTCS
ncbi:DgyrCDS7178 [Dimorphilus gyrociliatus]|uniref:DgyrCDS7178 n=1 Tax=Dimorphilus gyrociliatus TaxID=2664684 RepID=A0A7I8VQ86_9ANNE|nr:DgyrCDS7178 [Dimorphilus gyrociliatus]